ncbi:thioredoxin domain-containing protein [Pendulispora brunnea]|uniref:Thioredoxin domain-containing protein n=1 Tax=Pendulispora brunnea TaxID=2905690 RepID=A0ABZ2K7P5_9BACT
MAKESKDKAPESKAQPAAPEGGGMNTGVAVIGFVLCFLAGAALMWGYDTHRFKSGEITADNSAAGGAWSDSDSPVPVDSKDPVWGNRAAPVTIVEFSDFQCPYCGRVEPTIEQIKTTYGPDKVRIVWKNEPLPFHQNAKPSAEAGQGVFELKGNDAFWKFHDLAFKNQQQLTQENYEKWAQQAGVTDMAKYKAGLSSHKWADKVEKDHAIAKQVGINGTPGFMINGVSLSGAQPFEKFKSVIDQELQKAQAKIASGTAKDKVYVAMSQENKKAAPPPADDEDEKEDKSIWKLPVGKSPVLGSDKALVTIVEFSDFQCPYCKRGEESLKKVRETYGDKVRIVWKHEPLPMHPRAEPAAEVALEARAQKGDKGFWDAHDKLFESAPKLEDADLESVAKDLGLNVDKVKSAIKEHKYKKEIDADQDQADDFQASGTPHFFINGRRLVGAQPFEKFKGMIDEEITKANALLAKGTKPNEVYDTLVKDGKGVPEPEKKNVALPTNAPVKGNPSAKVTILEISDFQCPFCKRVNDSVKEVMKNYGDKVKITWRHLPLPMHPDAPLAAQAAQEAFKQKGSEAFWKMHDLLFENQGTEGGLKREALDKYAQQIGLDMAKFKLALDNQVHKAEVDADMKVANDAGINGTPAFIINGYYVNGAQPYAKFRKVIDRALAEAK